MTPATPSPGAAPAPAPAPAPRSPARVGLDAAKRRDLVAFLGGIARWHRAQIVWVSVLSLLAAASQVLLVVLLFRLLAGRDAGAEVLGLDVLAVGARTGVWGILALALLSAALPFAARRYVIRATTDYLIENVRWFRAKLSDMDTRYAILGMGINRAEIVRIMSSEVRYASLAYSAVLQIILPASLFVGALAILFGMSWVWTLSLLALILPFGVGAAFVVVSGIARNRELRDAAQAHSRAAATFVDAVSQHFSANRWGDELGRIASQTYSEEYAEAYGSRLTLSVLTTLVMDLMVFAAVAVLVVLLLRGELDLRAATGILFYGLVARFAFGKLGACVSLSISVVSQLPYYENFIRVKHRIEPPGKAGHSGWLRRLRGHSPDAAGPAEHVAIGRATPARVALIHPDGAGWISAHAYLAHLFPDVNLATAMRGAVLLSSGYPPLFEDFQSTFQVAPSASPATLLKPLGSDAARTGELAELLALGDRPLTPAAVAKVPPVARFLASYRYAADKGLSRRYVFVSVGDYLKLGAGERDELDAALEGAHAVLVGSAPALFKTFPADMPAVGVAARGDRKSVV